MSGRLVNSARVKKGEILPVQYVSLAEGNKPGETAAEIESVYLDYNKKRDFSGEFRDTVLGNADHERGGKDLPSRMSMREQGVPAKEMNSADHFYEAEPSNKFRKEILSASLFPNLYNRSNLLKSM